MAIKNLLKMISEQEDIGIPDISTRMEIEEFLTDLENYYYSDESDDDNTDSLILISVLRDTIEILNDDQLKTVLDSLYDEFDEWDDDSEIELDEEIDENLDEAAKVLKRDRNARRLSRKKYKQSRSKIRKKAKIYRKSSSYRRYSKKKKFRAKQNKTSTGKRIKRWV